MSQSLTARWAESQDSVHWVIKKIPPSYSANTVTTVFMGFWGDTMSPRLMMKLMRPKCQAQQSETNWATIKTNFRIHWDYCSIYTFTVVSHLPPTTKFQNRIAETTSMVLCILDLCAIAGCHPEHGDASVFKRTTRWDKATQIIRPIFSQFFPCKNE